MIGNIPAQNEWEINRLGKITASKIRNILVKPRNKSEGELSKTTLTYLSEKVTELATGTTRQISNHSIEWGNEYEPVAARILKKRFPDFEYLGKETQQFFEYSDFSGGSPDGYSKEHKLVAEIKCPENPANHTKYILLKTQEDLAKEEPDYYTQIHFNMMCVAKHLGVKYKEMTGVFLSYCPLYEGAFENLQSHLMLIEPDMDLYNKLTEALPKAEATLAAMYQNLLDKVPEPHVTVLEGTEVNGTSVLITK